jgi:calcineurin-like phosphoesterase family protein
MTSDPAPFIMPGPPIHGGLRARYEAWLVTQVPRTRSSDPAQAPTQVLQSVAGQATRRGVRWGETQAERTAAAWRELEETWLHTPERVWIWSDLHLWHPNICRYTGRPFFSVEAMNQHLLAQAQARVAPTDWLLCLGDLSCGTDTQTAAWLQACPGRKALLVGNHDVDRQKIKTPWVWDHFEALGATRELPVPESLADTGWGPLRTLWLTHYPLWPTWVRPQVLNVHGHVHHHVLDGPRMNVSVEQTGMAPMRLRDLLRDGPVARRPVIIDDAAHAM